MARVEFREPEEPIAVYLGSTWLWLAACLVLAHGRAAPCGTLQARSDKGCGKAAQRRPARYCNGRDSLGRGVPRRSASVTS